MAKYKCPQCGEEDKLSLIKFPKIDEDTDTQRPHDIKCWCCGHNCTDEEKLTIEVQ